MGQELADGLKCLRMKCKNEIERRMRNGAEVPWDSLVVVANVDRACEYIRVGDLYYKDGYLGLLVCCEWVSGVKEGQEEVNDFDEFCSWLSADDLLKVLNLLEGGKFTKAEDDAIAEALGYYVDDERKELALTRQEWFPEIGAHIWRHQNRLAESGGRGFDTAETLDDLRILDALHKAGYKF